MRDDQLAYQPYGTAMDVGENKISSTPVFREGVFIWIPSKIRFTGDPDCGGLPKVIGVPIHPPANMTTYRSGEGQSPVDHVLRPGQVGFSFPHHHTGDGATRRSCGDCDLCWLRYAQAECGDTVRVIVIGDGMTRMSSLR
jgi:hypothetical protein